MHRIIAWRKFLEHNAARGNSQRTYEYYWYEETGVWGDRDEFFRIGYWVKGSYSGKIFHISAEESLESWVIYVYNLYSNKWQLLGKSQKLTELWQGLGDKLEFHWVRPERPHWKLKAVNWDPESSCLGELNLPCKGFIRSAITKLKPSLTVDQDGSQIE